MFHQLLAFTRPYNLDTNGHESCYYFVDILKNLLLNFGMPVMAFSTVNYMQ